MMITLLLSLFSSVSSHALEANFINDMGVCLEEDYARGELDKSWKTYRSRVEERIKIQGQKLVSLPAPPETLVFIHALFNLKPFAQNINIAAKCPAMKQLTSDRTYLYVTGDINVLRKMAEEGLAIKSDPRFATCMAQSEFSQAIENIETELKRETTLISLQFLFMRGVGLLKSEDRKAALEALAFYESKGVTVDLIQRAYENPSELLFSNLPNIQSALRQNSFAEIISDLEEEYLEHHFMHGVISASDAPSLSAEELKEYNPVLSPDERIKLSINATKEADRNPLDVKVVAHCEELVNRGLQLEGKPLGISECAAISHVARTLWGEGRSCQGMGIKQFEAIGRVITDRALAVQRAAQEIEEVREYNHALKEKCATSSSECEKLKRTVQSGIDIFGREDFEGSRYPAAAQVTSKPYQFSIWNTFGTDAIDAKPFLARSKISYPANIPSLKIAVQKKSSGFDSRKNALCPQIEKEGPELWNRAVELATEIVMRPEIYKKTYQWTSGQKGRPVCSAYFYTHHGVTIGGQIELHGIGMSENGTPIKIQPSKPNPACTTMRLFITKPNINLGNACS